MKSETPSSGQTWDAAAYAVNGRFVADLSGAVVALLAPQPGETILDIGCGDGALTEQLSNIGAIVTGIDASPAMARAARERAMTSPHPFTVRHLAVQHLSPAHIDRPVDAAFSNAALHWIPTASHPAALSAIFAALRSGGRFVAEMGGLGNIAAIRTALQATLASHGIDAEDSAASFYPSPAEYRQLLEHAGFLVQEIALHPRPTPLPGGRDGMTVWLNTFRNGVLGRLAPQERAAALTRTVDLLRPMLADATGSWTADYVRLRFHATRPG